MSQRKMMDAAGWIPNNKKCFVEDDWKDQVADEPILAHPVPTDSLPWDHKFSQAEEISSEEPSEPKVSFRYPANVS